MIDAAVPSNLAESAGPASPEPGTLIEALDTPCLLVDLDRFERNVTDWPEAIRQTGARLRPHIKTHKVPALGRAQLAAGATGIAVAKVAEAEIFAEHGFEDITIAYPVIGASKWARVARLAESARMTVNVDSPAGALGLSGAASARGLVIGVQLEIDTGFHRCGMTPSALEEIESLARYVLSLPGLAFDGITTHRGMFFDGRDELTLEEAGIQEGTIMVELAERLRARGIPVPEVTAGGTMTGRAVATVDGITEVRAGTYVFQDLMQLGFGAARPDELALTVLCTVVSHQEAERATVDGGSKTFSGDRGLVGGLSSSFQGIAQAVGRDIVLERLSEEHGMVTIGSGEGVDVGDRLSFYPMHACTCVNLSDELIGVRDGRVEQVFPILARGKRT